MDDEMQHQPINPKPPAFQQKKTPDFPRQDGADSVLMDCTLFEMSQGRGSKILLQAQVTGNQSPNTRPTATGGM